MNRLALLAVLLTASAAFATGERIVLVPADSQLKDTLCLSMSCVEGRGEAVVAAKPVKGGVEVSVTMANGQRRLTHVVSTSDGAMSSTDLVHATTLVLKAIEVGPQQGAAPKVAVAPAPAKVVKLPRGRAIARR
jgi:hypothetical protein